MEALFVKSDPTREGLQARSIGSETSSPNLGGIWYWCRNWLRSALKFGMEVLWENFSGSESSCSEEASGTLAGIGSSVEPGSEGQEPVEVEVLLIFENQTKIDKNHKKLVQKLTKQTQQDRIKGR